jgi:hypothetical protein
MIINVIDMVDGTGLHQKKYLMDAGYTQFVELPLIGNGVQTMTEELMRRVGSEPITVLRVFGHGVPGYQSVSLGKRDPRKAENVNGSINLKKLPDLLGLKLVLGANARVELWGCEVAKDGGRLIQALSRLWGVSVLASKSRQHGHLSWKDVWEARPRSSGLVRVTPVPVEARR